MVDPSAPAIVGDYNSNGIQDLMVKFDRATVVRYLGETYVVTDVTGSDYEIALKITGEHTDGTLFEGTDTIRVINKGK